MKDKLTIIKLLENADFVNVLALEQLTPFIQENKEQTKAQIRSFAARKFLEGSDNLCKVYKMIIPQKD